jgi:hypothetical protein
VPKNCSYRIRAAITATTTKWCYIFCPSAKASYLPYLSIYRVIQRPLAKLDVIAGKIMCNRKCKYIFV